MADPTLEVYELDIFDNLYEYVKYCVEKLGENTDCWFWQFGKTVNGYGSLRVNNHTKRVHRISYELYYKVDLNELHIDHICKNRSCWNPNHLDAVSQEENNKRIIRQEQLYCKYGHLRAGIIRKNSVSRRCRVCDEAARRLRRKLAGH